MDISTNGIKECVEKGVSPFHVHSPGNVRFAHCWASTSFALHSSMLHMRRTLPFALVVPTFFGSLVHASAVAHACIPDATRLWCAIRFGDVTTFFRLLSYEPGPAIPSPSNIRDEYTFLRVKSDIERLAIFFYLQFYDVPRPLLSAIIYNCGQLFKKKCTPPRHSLMGCTTCSDKIASMMTAGIRDSRMCVNRRQNLIVSARFHSVILLSPDHSMIALMHSSSRSDNRRLSRFPFSLMECFALPWRLLYLLLSSQRSRLGLLAVQRSHRWICPGLQVT